METSLYSKINSEVNDANLLVIHGSTIYQCSPLIDRDVTLGRKSPTSSPDIDIPSKIVSRNHGVFRLISGRWYYFNNPGNTNTTFYNKKEIKPGIGKKSRPIPLSHGDSLRIDYKNLKTPDSRGVLILFHRFPASIVWKKLELKREEQVLIGRDASQCDIVFNSQDVSDLHCKITYLNRNYYLLDCESISGTWHNKERVIKSEILQEKDTILIGNKIIIFTENSLIYNRMT